MKPLPELRAAYERDSHYFAVIRVSVDEEARSFEIGLERDAYLALQRVLAMRPFESMPGVVYRYFFVDAVRMPGGKGEHSVSVRVEAEGRGKNFEAEVPLPLLRNILWFCRLRSFDGCDHLRDVSDED